MTEPAPDYTRLAEQAEFKSRRATDAAVREHWHRVAEAFRLLSELSNSAEDDCRLEVRPATH